MSNTFGAKLVRNLSPLLRNPKRELPQYCSTEVDMMGVYIKDFDVFMQIMRPLLSLTTLKVGFGNF